jgi:hypothetical protein
MNKTIVSLVLLLAVAARLAAAPPSAARDEAATTQPDMVVVARLTYENTGKDAACFADGFLADVDRQSSIRVQRHFAFVELADGDLYHYPIAILTGTKRLQLTDIEKRNLRDYLRRGGLLLASAGCSDSVWAEAFRTLMGELFPDGNLTPLPMTHPIFHRLYDIDRLVSRTGHGSPEIDGLEIAGRLAVIFAPMGLNDSAHAGPGCCCCGGNELRNAAFVNANVLVYTLTR